MPVFNVFIFYAIIVGLHFALNNPITDLGLALGFGLLCFYFGMNYEHDQEKKVISTIETEKLKESEKLRNHWFNEFMHRYKDLRNANRGIERLKKKNEKLKKENKELLEEISSLDLEISSITGSFGEIKKTAEQVDSLLTSLGKEDNYGNTSTSIVERHTE